MTGHTAINGRCHCGNIRFVLDWPSTETEIPIRRCGCTFCQKHGGAWTSHRDARLGIETRDPAALSKYRFGTGTADFHVCSICGIVPFVLSDIDDNLYAVVNVNTFEDAGGFSFSSTATDFDGEDTGDRLERRQRNWIPRVQIAGTVT